MANKDDYVDVVSSGKSFLPLDQTGCKLAWYGFAFDQLTSLEILAVLAHCLRLTA